MSATPFAILLIIAAGIVCFVLFTIFVMVPLFKGIGWLIASFFTGVFWIISHIFEFIGGMIGDAVRFIGAIVPMVLLSVFTVLNVLIGRWSAAGHFADSVKRECQVAGACLYRFFLRRPLKLFWLHGLLEGVEERMPEAVYASPGKDRPSRATGQFDGYTIVGSLHAGGSGGKLYIARPDEHKQRRLMGSPDHVVIKCFALTEGSSLPQIVRESRALEAAKQLGHVLDHGMDEARFFYVMPYHPGEHLGIVTRQLHGETDGRGLKPQQLTRATGYIRDLVATLSHYHHGGLWHKDVKPENIIVHDGRAHLVDLGLVTPLKSAMTLTTHGTEYFRDPEMVRQALRGVKVHQVNGAKFDIYAAGAVLYFILENTFPAHGGLSRFSLKSPEALRWIVRRAMAEYNQRYESADLMLADVEHVLSASDPFEIKPAELPSMRGETVTPPPAIDSPPPLAVSRNLAQDLPHEEHIAAKAHTSAPPRPPERQRLRVTNWWTGEYAVEDGARPGPHSGPAKGVPNFADARRTAREQIAAARARAREIRARAHAHRHKVGIERQPSATVGLIVFAVMLLLFAAIWKVSSSSMPMTANDSLAPGLAEAQRGAAAARQEVDRARESTRRQRDRVTRAGRNTAAVIAVPAAVEPPAPASPPAPELPWLLINDHPAKNDPSVQQRISEIITEYTAAGWTIIATNLEAEADVRAHLPARTERIEMTPLLTAALAQHDMGGILYFDALSGDGTAVERLRLRELAAPAMIENASD